MLGNKIRELRKAKDITQRELAREMDVTTAAIGLWEIGKREPDCKHLLALAKFFNVSVDYMLDDDSMNKITIMGSNGSYKEYYLKSKDIQTLELLAQSLGGDSKDIDKK